MGHKRKLKLVDGAVPTIFSFSSEPKRRKVTEERLERKERSETVRRLIMESEQSSTNGVGAECLQMI